MNVNLCVFCPGPIRSEGLFYAEYAKRARQTELVEIEAGLVCESCLDYFVFRGRRAPDQAAVRWIQLENVQLSCGTPTQVIAWPKGEKAGDQSLFQVALLPVLMDRLQLCREEPDALVQLAVQMYQNGDVSDENLWRALSWERLPAAIARSIYERLGFKPFAGYPLQKVEDTEPCLA